MLVNKLAEPFKIQMKTLNINFDLKVLNSVPPHIILERAIFRQILFNILVNAVKFNKQNGSITVEMSLVRQP